MRAATVISLLFLIGCAPRPPEVYLGDDGVCRFSATGSEAPKALCAGRAE